MIGRFVGLSGRLRRVPVCMRPDLKNAETPEEAFWRKLPPEKILEYTGWLLEA